MVWFDGLLSFELKILIFFSGFEIFSLVTSFLVVLFLISFSSLNFLLLL